MKRGVDNDTQQLKIVKDHHTKDRGYNSISMNKQRVCEVFVLSYYLKETYIYHCCFSQKDTAITQ